MHVIGSNFKPLRGLDVEVVHQLLKEVADKEMSMQEMMVECRDVSDERGSSSVYEKDRYFFLLGVG